MKVVQKGNKNRKSSILKNNQVNMTNFSGVATMSSFIFLVLSQIKHVSNIYKKW